MNYKVYLVKPAAGEAAYDIAGEIFSSLWKEITGNDIEIINDAMEIPPDRNIISLGSDTVNSFTDKMIDEQIIADLDVRNGSDDYQLCSLEENNRTVLFIAGGCGRSTIYAVYDFFRRRAGVRYFWDGDRIPKLKDIDIADINVIEKPRFHLRGIRYFAHRGLHRFQAEHWNFQDWKREIDWIMKKRLNFFMLRIGMDDLFQRAFPDTVSYPPEDKTDPEAMPRSYNDRTSFWSLKQRGILRKKVLDYAFERGLIHPEDVGTITHWYSRTPQALLEKENITFTNQKNDSYNDASGLVWNINDPATWERYWKLTETHIRDFGKPEMFHTIGLAERSYGTDDGENYRMKKLALSRISRMLRAHYPNAPMLLASWDFMSTWQNSDVRKLIKTLDPDKTIILDYTADVIDPQENIFTNWDIIGKFPWIFGIFQGLEPNNDLRGNYHLISERLQTAVADSACKGMVYWSEFAHGDAFMLEYFAANAWSGECSDLQERIEDFCNDRYPSGISSEMHRIWQLALKISQTRNWTHDIAHPMREINGNIFFNITTSPWLTKINPKVLEAIDYHMPALDYILETVPALFELVPGILEKNYNNEFIRRDIVDIARMGLSRILHALLLKLSAKLEQWRSFACSAEEIKKHIDLCGNFLGLLGELLCQHEDFSLYNSLVKLEASAPINPYSEQTLKGNTENGYCRSFYAEFFPLIYIPEFVLYKNWLLNKIKANDRSPFIAGDTLRNEQEEIREHFYSTPLKEITADQYSSRKMNKILEHSRFLISQIAKEHPLELGN